jgi:hypothetical protein
VPVSTTTSPVRHTAEVAVNSAFVKSQGLPGALDMGNESRSVPTRISPANPRITPEGPMARGLRATVLPKRMTRAKGRYAVMVLVTETPALVWCFVTDCRKIAISRVHWVHPAACHCKPALDRRFVAPLRMT